MVTFSAEGIPDVDVLLGEAPVTVASGYGGWSVVPRERRIGLTQWKGKDPIRMNLPILFDGIREGEGQEIDISRLSRMALPPESGGEPPQVQVAGRAVPKPGPVSWVIEGLEWGSNVVYGQAANGVTVRMRQDCVVKLLEFRGTTRATFAAIAVGKLPAKGWPKMHTVKKGETLKSIAVDEYQDISMWKKIANANGIRDPKGKLPKVLRLPAP
jgi:LysM repeat protein